MTDVENYQFMNTKGPSKASQMYDRYLNQNSIAKIKFTLLTKYKSLAAKCENHKTYENLT